MMQFIRQFVREEEGQDVIEYGLVLGLVALGGAVTLGLIGGQIDGLLVAVNTLLTTAIGAL